MTSRLSNAEGAIVGAITATALTPVLLGEVYGIPSATTTTADNAVVIQGKVITGLAKDTGHAWRAGDQLYWDTVASKATRTPGPYILGKANAAATAAATTGDVYVDARIGRLTGAATVADSTAVTAAAETAFDKTVTIPASTLADGSVFRIRGLVFHTTFAGTETAVIKVKINDGTNTIILGSTVAFDGTSSDLTVFDIVVTVRTDGATGTLVASAILGTGTDGVGTLKVSGVASSTFDTTAASTVSVTSTNSSTGESAVLRQLVVERIA